MQLHPPSASPSSSSHPSISVLSPMLAVTLQFDKSSPGSANPPHFQHQISAPGRYAERHRSEPCAAEPDTRIRAAKQEPSEFSEEAVQHFWKYLLWLLRCTWIYLFCLCDIVIINCDKAPKNVHAGIFKTLTVSLYFN